MPRGKKQTGKKKATSNRLVSSHSSDTTPVTIAAASRVTRTPRHKNPTSSAEASLTTRKRSTSASSKSPRAKRRSPRQQPRDDHSSLSENDGDGFDDTPLTRADIPKIVEAVINQFPTQGGSEQEEESDEDPHLGK